MNPKWKKLMAFSIFGVLQIMLIIVGTFFYGGILVGLLLGIIGIIPLYFLASTILSDPLFQLVDGKGILCFAADSTGFITPYNAEVVLPNIFMKIRGKYVDGIFDRQITSYLGTAAEKGYAYTKDGNLILYLPKTKVKKHEFRLAQARPMFFFNEKTGTFWDKDTMAGMESKVITENLVVLLLARVRNMINAVGALNKHYADLHKPNRLLEFLDNPWVRAVIIIILVAIVILFLAPNLPKIIGSVETLTTTAFGATGGSASAPITTPTPQP